MFQTRDGKGATLSWVWDGFFYLAERDQDLTEYVPNQGWERGLQPILSLGLIGKFSKYFKLVTG